MKCLLFHFDIYAMQCLKLSLIIEFFWFILCLYFEIIIGKGNIDISLICFITLAICIGPCIRVIDIFFPLTTFIEVN